MNNKLLFPLLLIIVVIFAASFSQAFHQLDETKKKENHDRFLRNGLLAARKTLPFSVNPVGAVTDTFKLSLDDFAKEYEQDMEKTVAKILDRRTQLLSDENNHQQTPLQSNVAPSTSTSSVSDPASEIPSCITNGGGSLSSGNFFLFPYGYYGDYGKYAQCTESPNKKWCLAELSMKCVNIFGNASYNYQHFLKCNGPSSVNGIGACYNTTACPTQKSLDDQFAAWSYLIKDYTSPPSAFLPGGTSLMKSCWGLELLYEFSSSEQSIIDFTLNCDPLNSYLLLETWCDAEKPVPDSVRDSDSTKAVLYSFLTIISFAAFATFVGILRRIIKAYRQDFNDDDGVVDITLASQEGRNRGQNRDTLSLLDRLLYGAAELSTTAQDAAQMQQASITNSTANQNEDLYVTQLDAGDPEKAFRRTIGDAAERERNSGVFDLNLASYDERSPLRGGNSTEEDGCCASCCCSSESCWRSVSASVVTWFDAFDVLSGLKDLVTPLHSNLPTSFFDGLRTIAMLFVVLGHTAFFPRGFGDLSNEQDLLAFMKSYQSVLLFPALLAVDTFFYIGGFLSMHLMTKQFDKFYTKRRQSVGRGAPTCSSATTGSMSIISLAYINRYLRLTPSFLVIIAIVAWVLPLTVSGPLSRIVTESTDNKGCKEYFWAYATYWYGTYFNDRDFGDKVCAPVSWYLSIDIIYFLFVPVLAAIDAALRERSYGLRYIMPTLIGITTIAFWIYSVHQHPIAGAFTEKDGNIIIGYYRAIDRVPPYAFGVLTALLNNLEGVHEFFKRSKLACWISNSVALCLALAIWNVVWWYMKTYSAYIDPDQKGHDFEKYLMHTFYFMWGLPCLLITLPALGGFKYFFTDFLSSPIFGVTSKLTYGMYLLHPVVISYYSAEDYDFYDFQRFKYYVQWLGNACMAATGAIVIFVLVDRPVGKFCTWLSTLFGVKKNKRF